MREVRTPSDLRIDIKPTTKHRYVGIEIEFLSPVEREQILQRLFSSPLKDYVSVHGDSSIDTEMCDACPTRYIERISERISMCPSACTCSCHLVEYSGHEVCLLMKETEVKRVVKLFSAFLASIKAKVNKSCGLHVHLDMRHRPVDKAFYSLRNAQRHLYAMNPGRRKNTYCEPLPSNQDLYKWLFKVIDDDVKHFGINVLALGEHNTIEVRMHRGTLSDTDIYNWVGLLVALVDTPITQRDARDVVTLTKRLKLPATLSKYVYNRTRGA